MVNLKINDKQIQVKKNTTIIQACSKLNIQVPRFCYHPRLTIAGNCRICLVEIKNAPKLAASCAMPVMDNMEIYTDSLKVKRAREDVIELLLINHPLDCPICDQGGECDLQDQTMVYGNHRGRFNEYKRTVSDKDYGPLISTVMTRCIHCTRCVRFSTEIAGVSEMGSTGRGNTMEIGTYIDKAIHSELSGNMIDVCPVGAITSKPYAFAARPWELESIESIDVFDGIGSNIRVDVRGRDIMRILPKQNKHINEDWISDKIRFCYDGFKNQRIETPMLYLRKWNMLSTVNWTSALDDIASKINEKNNVQFIAGNTVDAETLYLIKKLSNKTGNSNIYTMNPQLSPDLRRNYIFDSNIDNIFNTEGVILLGTNMKTEAPMLNAKLRKIQRKNNVKVYSIASSLNLAIKHKHIGNSIRSFIDVIKGNNSICKDIINMKSITVVIGSSVLHSNDLRLVSLATSYLKQIMNVSVNVLQPSSNSVTASDIGYPSLKHNSVYYNQYSINREKIHNNVYYYVNTNNLPIDDISNDSYVIYQGHHGYKLSSRHADVILPGTSFLEKQGLYANTEGRLQETKIVLDKLNNSIQDWKIVQGVAQWLDYKLNYPKAVRTNINYGNIYEIRIELKKISNSFDYIDFIVPNKVDKILNKNLRIYKYNTSAYGNTKAYNVRPYIINYFTNNSITANSISLTKRSKINNIETR